MRLVRVPDGAAALEIKFVEIIGRPLEEYCILSHTWGTEEVVYADVISDQYMHKKGWAKIESTLLRARTDGYGLAWVDTCCIDKQSSAELSEAINSMYKLYQGAAYCYAYLEDVTCNKDDEAYLGELQSARWFTRGWTLQELLAPRQVSFYSKHWQFLGEKDTMTQILSKITLIPEDYITGRRNVQSASVSRRMSWAASRSTTRAEDSAYCLMGLFDINMPMLYGEGGKAFLRLQEEIMKSSDDQTLFAWHDESDLVPYGGLLATSPAAFADSGHYVPVEEWRQRASHHMTNRGIQIELNMSRFHDATGKIHFKAALECAPPATISLEKLNSRSNQYLRTMSPSSGQFTAGEFLRKQICVPQVSSQYRDSHRPFFLLKLVVKCANAYVIPFDSKLHSAFWTGVHSLHEAIERSRESIAPNAVVMGDIHPQVEIARQPGPAVSILFEIRCPGLNNRKGIIILFELTVGVAVDGQSVCFEARRLTRRTNFGKTKDFVGQQQQTDVWSDARLLSRVRMEYDQESKISICDVFFDRSQKETR